MSFQVKKWQNYFFQKKRACARGGNFFSRYNQLMHRGEYFKLVRITIETQVPEVRNKSEKLTFEGLVVGQINGFFKQACSTGDKFFTDHYQKMRQGNLFKRVTITFEV